MKNVVRINQVRKLPEEIKKQNIEKMSFLSHISHGIRTPLNSIMGFSKLLSVKKMIDPKQKEYVQGILNGSNTLLQFVENIMDLSQFEAKNYTLRVKNYTFNQILWDFTEDFYNSKNESRNSNTNLILVWENKEKDLKVETDAELLKKALQRIINLLSEKFPNANIELGYRITNNNLISVYVRPSKEDQESIKLLHKEQFFAIDEDDSFEWFNYKVLVNSVALLGGNLAVNSDNQEFIIEIPMKFD